MKPLQKCDLPKCFHKAADANERTYTSKAAQNAQHKGQFRFILLFLRLIRNAVHLLQQNWIKCLRNELRTVYALIVRIVCHVHIKYIFHCFSSVYY